MASRPSSGLRGGRPGETPAAGGALARLERAFLVILEAARSDPGLAQRLANALAEGASSAATSAQAAAAAPQGRTATYEPRAGQTRPPARASAPAAPARRAPAVLDPYAIYDVGWEAMLRERLHALGVEQLKDIVAEHTMDPSGQALGWSEPERLVELIVQGVVDRSERTI